MDHHPPPMMRYTANFSYPTDQMPCTSNRSRSDSGTSGSSYSSSGSGKPPRRRSHRPRGCRGGSSRRSRNNSIDEKNSQKNHSSNGGNNNSGSHSSSNNNSSQKHSGNFHNHRNKNTSNKPGSNDFNRIANKLNKDKTPTILKNQQRAHSKDRQWQSGRSSMSDLQYQQQPHHRSTPFSEFSFPAQNNHPPGFHTSHMDFKTGTLHNAGSNGSCFPPQNPSTDFSVNYFGHDSSYYNDSSSSWDFPALQPSYSDSSSEAIYMENQPPSQYTIPDSCNNDLGGNQILPPMPVSKESAPKDNPMSRGPNPYALKPNPYVDGNLSHHQPSRSSNLDERTMMTETTNFVCGNSVNTPSKPSASPARPSKQKGAVGGRVSGNKDTYYYHPCDQFNQRNRNRHIERDQPSNDYRAERIEKQRQTVEGGSLFVTSPRSFLMGWKRPTMALA